MRGLVLEILVELAGWQAVKSGVYILFTSPFEELGLRRVICMWYLKLPQLQHSLDSVFIYWLPVLYLKTTPKIPWPVNMQFCSRLRQSGFACVVWKGFHFCLFSEWWGTASEGQRSHDTLWVRSSLLPSWWVQKNMMQSVQSAMGMMSCGRTSGFPYRCNWYEVSH